MVDGFEIIGLFFGFWLFIFSTKFRTYFLKKWEEESWIENLLTVIFGIIPAILFGLLPFWLFLFL
jgi:hypothetical protein